MRLSCEWSWHDRVDNAKGGSSKGRRLVQWVDSPGLNMPDVIAFGDNYHDLSMLETAGRSVAMGRASEAINARANRVIGTNFETSIADILCQFILSIRASLRRF